MDPKEVWNMKKLIKRMPNEEAALSFAEEIGLIPKEFYCKKHKKNTVLVEGHNLGSFLCKSKYAMHKISRTKNTWFEHSKISVETSFILIYCFTAGLSYEQAIKECSCETSSISRETVSDRYSFAREICMISLDNDFEEEGKIGGPGKVVEIDETKIGKGKYQRGRIVEGNWILGLMERVSNKIRLEICPDNRRDEKTLIDLIKKHVASSTEIHTDCWKGYINLNLHGYVHKSVNHSENFVDPETGAHTQGIESSWRFLKRKLGRGGVNKTNLDMHLCEFLWRKRVKNNNFDPFSKMLGDIKIVYPGI